ncbi:MAG TPA: M48 family metalloprotease [Methylomirabilota bacterium]|jgi:Zn-dependent protease with chaperone function
MWIRAPLTVVATGLMLSACATAPDGAYYAAPTDPSTVMMSQILHRAAAAGGDDPQRYSFAFIKSPTAAAYSDEDATFYFTDGLTRQPRPIIEAAVAHEVAHELLGHVGSRRKLSMALTASFSAAGLFAPGAGMLDFLVNPLVVRAFGRQQELQADQKAVEILRAMGYTAPRRLLVTALQTLAAHTPKEREGLEGLLATHPALDERTAALEPLEPSAATRTPVARVKPVR